MLKYLDVLIGLALVMLLVSPMVTSITHAYMWVRNRRTIYLQQMLHRLLLQFDSLRALRFEITDAQGGGLGQIDVRIGEQALGKTDARGHLVVPQGIPATALTAGKVRLQLTTPTGSRPHSITARATPHASFDDVVVLTPPAQNGVIKITHAYDGPPSLASRTARLEPASPAPTTSAMQVSVNGTVLPTRAVAGGVEVDLPAVKTTPFEYTFELTLGDANKVPVTGEAVRITFVRFEGRDHKQTTRGAVAGLVDVPVPFVLDKDFATRLTTAIVNHPLLSRAPVKLPNPFPKIPPFKNRSAEVVEREQLIRVLLELAAAEGEAHHFDAADLDRLRFVLAVYGISDPAATLSKVRHKAQELEEEEPQTAVHIRHAQAIVHGAKSEFVGKVNHWFDAASARATQQYAAECRAVTVGAALLVAVVIQLDSLGLLQRLSADPELRNSLVAEAKAEQEKIDKAKAANTTTTEAATTDELALAVAKRDEIERNLAKLRLPSFAVVPDHFVWQRPQRGRLERNPTWSTPYPANLYLTTGGTTYTVPIRWRRDVLADIKASIDASGAPVNTTIETSGADVVVRAAEPFELHAISSLAGIPVRNVHTMRATLRLEKGGEKLAQQLLELTLDGTPYPVKADAYTLKAVADAISASRAPVAVTCYDTALKRLDCSREGTAGIETTRHIEITVLDPVVRRVALVTAADGRRDLLTGNELVAGAALPVPLLDVAQAMLDANVTAWPEPPDPSKPQKGSDFAAALLLDGKATPLKFNSSRFLLFRDLDDAIRKARVPVTVKCYTATRKLIECREPVASDRADDGKPYFFEVTAIDAGTREIRLLWNEKDPLSNILNDTTRVGTTWRLSNAVLEKVKPSAVMVAVGSRARGYAVVAVPQVTAGSASAHYAAALTREPAAAALRTRAVEFPGDDLVITAKRLGSIQLRHTAAAAESNVFNSHEEHAWPFIELFRREQGFGGPSLDPGLFGILLSWVLLSLGAPFWYDMLKNLLKLRPTAAAEEERARTDRAETKAKKTK